MITSQSLQATEIRAGVSNAPDILFVIRLRQIFRSICLVATFAWAALEIVCALACTKHTGRTALRALWLQRTCRRLLRCLNARVEFTGVPPCEGLLVCNHLSYLDILVLSTRQPMSFLSKKDVKNWPIIGWFTNIAGTIYIDREQRSDVARASADLRQRIVDGSVVVLFPEGTSSDGSIVLPFRPSLLQPAVEQGCPVTPAHLAYQLDDGSVEDEVCYWRDMTFGPHLLNLLGKREIRARVHFGETFQAFGDRKELAILLREQVQTLGTGTSKLEVFSEV